MASKAMGKEAVLRRVSSVVLPPLVRAAVRLRVSPNVLTVVGLVTCLAAAALVGSGNLLLGGLVVLLAGLFDLLDGAVARASGMTSRFGALVDSVADRVSEAALLCALVVLYTTRGQNAGIWLSLAALVGSFLTSYVRARAEGLGLQDSVGVLTRAERVAVLALGLVLDGVTQQAGALIATAIIAVFSYVTVVQRVAHAWKQTRK
ncbi:MAG: CDP-alcohol phosphatidyltransferase family protein [Chloroflexi bacterium]|nr:CDP-alcohol phosphatidyltransferase family protein [Chloroflexota bacterium]